LIDRQEKGNHALIVHPQLLAESYDDLSEFKELVLSAGIQISATLSAKRERPDPAYFIGRGKLDEIKQAVAENGADLILVNHALSPVQERNIEREACCRVLDRTTLILDIFAQRARSHEGKLQVELAQLRHLSTRLVRGWTHLERQKGGIGLRGPGETQLETDRRLLGDRVKNLRKRLEKVDRRRDQSRRGRARSGIPVVSLVGYTNAGKSTLFNSLTNAEVLAADQLFATLDPTLRRLDEPGIDVLLADTVGFIRRLPHELVAAFRSTLQETLNADLLLHVVDASSSQRSDLIDQVNTVLSEIGAEEVPQLMVYNKIDQCDQQPRIQYDNKNSPQSVWVSALHGEGLELVKKAIRERLMGALIQIDLNLPLTAGALHAELHRLGLVQNESLLDDGGWRIRIAANQNELQRLVKLHQIDQLEIPQTKKELNKLAHSSGWQ